MIMGDWFRKSLETHPNLVFEIIIFILGIIAVGIAAYFTIFHYEELPEYATFGRGQKKAVFLVFLPGVLLMWLSRYLQNQRRSRHDVVMPPLKPGKKKKKYEWDE